jgi:hypothetical protein
MYQIIRSNGEVVKSGFRTPRGAKIALTRMGEKGRDLLVLSADESRARRVEANAGVPTKIVKNLLSGALVEIDIDTPLCCDPSSETYWSM